MTEPIAVIEVGSSAIRMVIAEIGPKLAIRTLENLDRSQCQLVCYSDRGKIDAGCDGRRGVGLPVLSAQRDELVLRILPRDRSHVGRLHRTKFKMVGAPVGVDHQVRGQVGRGGLQQNVNSFAGAGAALVLFKLILHPRPDIAAALYSPGFCLKVAAAAVRAPSGRPAISGTGLATGCCA